MSETERSETFTGSTSDSDRADEQAVAPNRRNLNLSRVDTANMLKQLSGLFDDVMSGRDYDASQVQNATSLTNTMIKVLRFEFDVYKYFAGGGKSSETDTIASIASYLRLSGDQVMKADGPGSWLVNGQRFSEEEIVIRANTIRSQEGLRLFRIE